VGGGEEGQQGNSCAQRVWVVRRLMWDACHQFGAVARLQSAWRGRVQVAK
jgi:hypothetical protein